MTLPKMGRKEVDEFIEAYGVKLPNTHFEIEDLPKVLHKDEKLIALVEGNLIKVHGKARNGVGLLIATNQRVLFYRRSFIGTVTMEEFAINKVSSVSFRSGMIFASLAITVSNNEAIIDHCKIDSAEKFHKILQAILKEADNKATEKLIVDPNNDPYDKIEKLYALKQKGIITEEEFTAHKAKLLGI